MPIRTLSFAVLAIAIPTSSNALSQSGIPRLEGPVRTFSGEQLDSRVGTVTDVGIDAQLNVYVLDGARGAVDVFRWDGTFLAEGSLDSARTVAAKAMAVTPTGHVLVLPADGRSVLEFQLDGATLRRLSSFTISVRGGDACAGRRSVFVIGFDSDSESLVHEYGFDGRSGRKFGAALDASLTGSAAAALQWRIACSFDGVAVASVLSPTIELYDPGGRLVLRGNLKPYRSLLIQQSPPNGYSLTIPPGGADMILSVLLFYRTVAVQVRRSGNVTPNLVTFVFRPGGESGHSVLTSTWPLIKRVYGSWAITIAGQPHPAIALYRIHGQE